MSGGDLDNSFPDDLDELDDSEVGELVWPQFLLLFVNVAWRRSLLFCCTGTFYVYFVSFKFVPIKCLW
jgi:hypothetical protein